MTAPTTPSPPDWPLDTEPMAGEEMHALAARLYPICRSITGDGVRQTLKIVQENLPLTLHEVPSGTKVFDWIVPPEWNLRSATLRNAAGEAVLDASRHSLHVMSYSVPVRCVLTRAELKEHVFTLPDQPDRIPYRTSYYNEAWGLCMTHRQWESLPDGNYEVRIDADLAPGHLTYGECVLPGRSSEEVLLSTHVCHPSLANDNLSGITVLARLGRYLASVPRRYTYRLLFIPGTIGSITWMARNEADLARIRHALVLACVGDAGGPTYKRSRRGTAAIDRAVEHVLQHAAPQSTIEDFVPYGYDERQFCSPGINLPAGLFMRSKFGTFPEYHTSADNLEFIRPEHLAGSYDLLRRILFVVDHDAAFRNLQPKGEPQLGRRGLYSAIGGDPDRVRAQMALLWVLNLSDGSHTLLDIAERSGLPFETLHRAAELLRAHELLEPA